MWYNRLNGGAIGNYLMTIPEQPLRRTEQYLNRIATGEGEIPSQPESRLEQYLEAIAEGGGGGGGVNVVQTTGTSTTDVMSQKAVTSMIYADPSNGYSINLGDGANAYGTHSISIGATSGAIGNRSLAIGDGAVTVKNNSVAIGRSAKDSRVGEVNIGAGNTSYGYNGTSYRVLGGVHDGVDAHDAATKGQLDAISSYSETEVDTGATWIDGKTIYKKSYSQTIFGNTQSFNLNITNLYEIVKIEAIWHTGGTLTNGLPTTFATTSSVTDTVTVITYGGTAEITSSGRSGMKGVITFYYTKSS